MLLLDGKLRSRTEILKYSEAAGATTAPPPPPPPANADAAPRPLLRRLPRRGKEKAKVRVRLLKPLRLRRQKRSRGSLELPRFRLPRRPSRRQARKVRNRFQRKLLERAWISLRRSPPSRLRNQHPSQPRNQHPSQPRRLRPRRPHPRRERVRKNKAGFRNSGISAGFAAMLLNVRRCRDLRTINSTTCFHSIRVVAYSQLVLVTSVMGEECRASYRESC